jgi:phosphoserine phosphatase
MSEVLITIAGPDHPGIMASLLETLVQEGAEVRDLGQAVTHGFLSLSFVLNKESKSLEALQHKAASLDLTFKQRMLKDEAPKHGAGGYIFSCVAPDAISTAFLKDVSGLFSQFGLNMESIENMNPGRFNALDIHVACTIPVDNEALKTALIALSNTHKTDAAFMRNNLFRYNKRLIVFDMDSTLIQHEVIDEMAAVHGIGDKVKLITERAMNGELDFNGALTERVALLKGLKRKDMESIFNRLTLTPGTESFIRTVKSLGYKTAIASGGFKFFAESLKEKLGMDYAFANDLEWNGDELTGVVKGEIVNAQKKAELLETLAKKEHINLEQIVAVGDGANDLPMLARAGLGIAFHAKDKVRREARHQMSHGPMTTILYFLGIPGNHLE